MRTHTLISESLPCPPNAPEKHFLSCCRAFVIKSTVVRNHPPQNWPNTIFDDQLHFRPSPSGRVAGHEGLCKIMKAYYLRSLCSFVATHFPLHIPKNHLNRQQFKSPRSNTTIPVPRPHSQWPFSSLEISHPICYAHCLVQFVFLAFEKQRKQNSRDALHNYQVRSYMNLRRGSNIYQPRIKESHEVE